MRAKKMKMNPKFRIEERYILYIYLKKKWFCVAKSTPLTEEQLDEFYAELNNSDLVMEFGEFYFNKTELRYAKTKKIILDVKAMIPNILGISFVEDNFFMYKGYSFGFHLPLTSCCAVRLKDFTLWVEKQMKR